MKSKNTSHAAFFLVLVISIVASGIIGGLVGAGFISNRGLQNIDTQSLNLRVEEDSESTRVVEKALPSVVSIVITKEIEAYNLTGPDQFPFELFFAPGFNSPQPQQNKERVKQQIGGGSGFIVGSDGLILTNRHVVSDPKADYTVILNDGTQYNAQVLARDTVNDLALIKIDAKNLSVLKLGDSETLKIGQTVIAIGFTLSEYKNTVTKGVVSGVGRRVIAGDGLESSVLDGVIQTDAAINPGNSGGPLLDLSGAVIGISTAVNLEGQLIGFAIPINEAKQAIESVKQHGKIVRAWLGVRYVPIDRRLAEMNQLSVDYGALVVRGDQPGELAVAPGSPADKAGVLENDIILEIDGKKVDESNTLARIVAKKKPGDKVKMKLLRKGKEIEAEVILEERKQ